MSTVRKSVRHLERFRATVKGKKIAEPQGSGKSAARAAKVIAMRESIARKKASGKLVSELETLKVADLNKKLAETRQELFNLRFKHATSQLTDVASIPAAKRRIARILTLIKQKEVGA